MPPEPQIEDVEPVEEVETEPKIKGSIQPDDMELEDEEDPDPSWLTGDEEPEDEKPAATPEPKAAPAEKPKGEKPAKELEEKPAAEPEPIEIDGKPVPRSDLESAWKERSRAREIAAKAKHDIEAAQFTLESVAKDPAKALLAIYTKEFGGDRKAAREKLHQIAHAIVLPHYQRTLMKPEEQRAFDAKAELSELEEQLAERRRRVAEEEQAIEVRNTMAVIDKSIDEALEATKASDPKFFRPYIYQAIREQFAAGQKPDALAATKEVIEHFEAQTQARLDALAVEDILKRRPQFIEALRKTDLEKLQQNRKPPSTKTPTAGERPTNGDRRGKQKLSPEAKEAYRARNGRYF